MKGLINTAVFQLNCVEFIIFVLLTLPFGHKLKNKILSVFGTSRVANQLNKIHLILILLVGLLFLDTVRQENHYHEEHSKMKIHEGSVTTKNMIMQQRNIYIYGICLFLSWANYRTIILMQKLTQSQQNEEELLKLKQNKGGEGQQKAEQKPAKQYKDVQTNPSGIDQDALQQQQKNSQEKKKQ